MKTKLTLILGLLTSALSLPAFAQGTAFTYQGRLTDNGGPANGNHDLRFYLRDAATAGNPVGATNTVAPVAVSNGLFTVTLDFGAGVFTGPPRWLEIGVRTNGSVAAYFTLSPRQPLTPAPYATYAASAGTGGGSPWSLNGNNTYYNGGNVGIGTPSPVTTLDIRGPLTLEAGGDAALYTGTGFSELNRYLSLLNSPSLQSASGLKAGGILVSDSYGYANPGKNDLIVKGNVGIGTTTPASKLTVFRGGYGFEHTDGDVRLGSYVDSTAGWLGTISNNKLNFFVNGGQASMTIETTGNVGIGTDSPGEKLDIVGHLRVFGNAFKSTGGTSWGMLSDRRLKQDVRDFEPGLNEVLQLRSVRFHYRDDPKRGLTSASEEVGFIAQEVREVIPDAVIEGKDGYLSLKADPIHWAAINAIQELNTKLESELKRKDVENAALKQRLETLERLMNQKLNGGAR